MSPSSLRKPLMAANWKMYKGPPETHAFLHRFLDLYPPHADRTIIFFPPAISVPAFQEAAASRPDLEVGIQDVHTESEGAHTGAISADMAADAGVGWGLAGHSERRTEFGDEDTMVGAKLARLLEAGLRPVLCVGETLEERRAGELHGVLRRQVETAADVIVAQAWTDAVLAYEPVWAIGTGETATPADAAEAHGLVRAVLADRLGPDAAAAAAILYGGSVKPENIESLLAADGVDGVLVGGASLEPESFAQICLASTD